MEKQVFKISNFDLEGDYLFFNFKLNQTINNIGMFTDGELFTSDDSGGDDEEEDTRFTMRIDKGFATIQEACDIYRTQGIWGGLYVITFVGESFAVGSQMYHQNNPFNVPTTHNYYHFVMPNLNRVFAISCSQNGIITEINEITNC